MGKLRLILLPFSWIYGGIMALRNVLFDLNIFKTYKSTIPTISIGNLSMGGTGKTPHVDFIVSELKKRFNITILSRGYGRKTKGYLKATNHSNAETIGDEPLIYKTKHVNDIEVVVCEDRTEGAKRIEKEISKTELIVLDDAYQHRKIGRHLNILLTDYSAPFYKDYVVPAGNLREFRKGEKRADLVVITKCPTNISEEQKTEIKRKINLLKHKNIFFSSIKYGAILPIQLEHESNKTNLLEDLEQVVLVTGIANPTPLINQLEKKYTVETIQFADHHHFTSADIRKVHSIFDTFANKKKAIITTEKDYMRLLHPAIIDELKSYPWFYQSIAVEVDKQDAFFNTIEDNVRKD